MAIHFPPIPGGIPLMATGFAARPQPRSIGSSTPHTSTTGVNTGPAPSRARTQRLSLRGVEHHRTVPGFGPRPDKDGPRTHGSRALTDLGMRLVSRLLV